MSASGSSIALPCHLFRVQLLLIGQELCPVLEDPLAGEIDHHSLCQDIVEELSCKSDLIHLAPGRIYDTTWTIAIS